MLLSCRNPVILLGREPAGTQHEYWWCSPTLLPCLLVLHRVVCSRSWRAPGPGVSADLLAFSPGAQPSLPSVSLCSGLFPAWLFSEQTSLLLSWNAGCHLACSLLFSWVVLSREPSPLPNKAWVTPRVVLTEGFGFNKCAKHEVFSFLQKCPSLLWHSGTVWYKWVGCLTAVQQAGESTTAMYKLITEVLTTPGNAWRGDVTVFLKNCSTVSIGSLAVTALGDHLFHICFSGLAHFRPPDKARKSPNTQNRIFEEKGLGRGCVSFCQAWPPSQLSQARWICASLPACEQAWRTSRSWHSSPVTHPAGCQHPPGAQGQLWGARGRWEDVTQAAERLKERRKRPSSL